MSTAHYTRIEQARGARPSRAVLHEIARALRPGDVETTHLLTLAGKPPAPRPGPAQHVPSSILTLVERLPETATLVLDAKLDVLAWNPLAAALLEDFSSLKPSDRNLIRRFFLHPDPARRHYGLTDGTAFGAVAAAHLRTVAARYPKDPDVTRLVRELRTSPEFTRLWETARVHAPRHLTKQLQHPVVGALTLDCDILTIPDRDQHVVLLTAEPGSASAQTLRLLSVAGIQDMEVPG